MLTTAYFCRNARLNDMDERSDQIVHGGSLNGAAVMINPDLRYTPEPDCPPFRIIPAVAIQGCSLSLRFAPFGKGRRPKVNREFEAS